MALERRKESGGAWETVEADGNGGSQTSREAFSSISAHTVCDGSDTKLPWIKIGGDTLLDLTTPTIPAIIESGVYAVQAGAYVVASDDITSGYFWFGLDLDLNGDNVAFADGTAALEADVPAASTCSQHVTYYLAAGQVVVAHVRHGNPLPIEFYMQASIQRLS